MSDSDSDGNFENSNDENSDGNSDHSDDDQVSDFSDSDDDSKSGSGQIDWSDSDDDSGEKRIMETPKQKMENAINTAIEAMTKPFNEDTDLLTFVNELHELTKTFRKNSAAIAENGFPESYTGSFRQELADFSTLVSSSKKTGARGVSKGFQKFNTLLQSIEHDRVLATQKFESTAKTIAAMSQDDLVQASVKISTSIKPSDESIELLEKYLKHAKNLESFILIFTNQISTWLNAISHSSSFNPEKFDVISESILNFYSIISSSPDLLKKHINIVLSLINRFDLEIQKLMHSYSIEILKYSCIRLYAFVILILDHISKSLVNINDVPPTIIHQVSISLLEHIYFLQQHEYDSLATVFITSKFITLKNPKFVSSTQIDMQLSLPKQFSERINSLAQSLYPLKQTKPVLMQIYHASLFNNYSKARDLMHFVSGRLDSLDTQDAILYNRCLTQMGTAAFQLGLFNDTYSLLSDLCAYRKLKEHIASQTSTFHSSDPSYITQISYFNEPNSLAIEIIYQYSAIFSSLPIIYRNSHFQNFAHQPKSSAVTHFIRQLQNCIQDGYTGPATSPKTILAMASLRVLQPFDNQETLDLLSPHLDSQTKKIMVDSLTEIGKMTREWRFASFKQGSSYQQFDDLSHSSRVGTFYDFAQHSLKKLSNLTQNNYSLVQLAQQAHQANL